MSFEELVIAFKQASPRTMSLSRDIVREGLESALKIVEREHWKQVEAAFYEGYHQGSGQGYDQRVKDATERD